MNKVGVIGFPISHSLSPAMHNAAFEALGMVDWAYDAMEIPPDIVRYGVLEPKRHGYVGINVTIPHKQAVMQYVKPDQKSQAIGAVNTIDFRSNVGTNTDADGLIADLNAHDIPLKDEQVIVLGAGGAARAAVYGLAKEGAQVAIVNRTMKRAQDLVMDMQALANIDSVTVKTLDEAAEWGAALIVNCTSVGMNNTVGESPWIEGVPFPRGITVYDMIYTPSETKLMHQAIQHGGRAVGGAGMLVRQGAAAFEIWTGREAPIDVMFNALNQALEARG